MSSSLYRKLDTLRKNIRLLIISPGEYETPLSLNLAVVSLLEKPAYHALSYCWGDEKETETISIGREELPVTVNVVQALRRVRSRDAALSIWIDAVCINQHDPEERGHQVRMMVDVYSQAYLVHVWLGEDTPLVLESRKAHAGISELAQRDMAIRDGLSIAGQLAADTHHLDSSMMTLQDLPQSLVASTSRGEKSQDSKARIINATVALMMLMRQPWWQRVWILQEIILATRDPVIHFSSHTFPLSQMIEAGVNYLRHSKNCCKSFWVSPLVGVCGGSKHSSRINILRQQFGRAKDIHELQTHYKRQKLSLLNALQVSRERKTSDPRDHFYGILGLVEGFHRSQVNVDYREEIDIAFSRLIRLLTIESGNLNHLQLAVGSYDYIKQRNPFNLPSWVIDFATPMLKTIDHSLFHAYGLGSHREHWENRIMDLTDFFVYGIEIDVGFRHCERFEARGFESSARPDSWQARDKKTMIMQLELLALRSQLFSGPPKESVKFWRWVLYGLFRSDEASLLRRIHVDDLDKIVEHKSDPSAARPSDHHPTVSRTLEALLGRGTMTYFVTGRGRLGAATRNISSQHRVFVLSGVPAPVLLECLSDEENLRRECRGDSRAFKFAGLCYIDGLMDGEAVTEDVKWEAIVLQ